MSRKLVLVVITSVLLVSLHGSTAFARIISSDEFLDSYDVEVSNSTAYVSVPFYYQSNNYYCGPAALEMVFDYYGGDIPQEEIADVARTYPYVTYTDELRRAAHFSNLSTSLGDEMSGNITGYSARKIGCGAFEQGGLTIDDLKILIDRKEPVIVLMWWTPSKNYGHYRVVVGYNETHITMHDPWNKDAWGGVYGGANTSMTYSTFLDLWEYVGYWGLLVCPWDVELQIPETVVEGENFEVIANITYTCFTPFDLDQYPASSCNATIQLSEGLKPASGETPQHSLGNINAGSCVHTSWSLNAKETGFHNISVTVAGIIEGSVGIHGTYPSYDYEDAIGGSCIDSLLISNQTRRVHNLDTGYNYTTIQGAINANDTDNGHTIFVQEGTYYEHLSVNKSLSLIGENRYTTIVDGNGTGVVISVIRSDVIITGFTIRNGTIGVKLHSPGVDQCQNITISHNLMTGMENGGCGILVFTSHGNRIIQNMISNSWVGISLGSSYSNIITQNIISNNGRKGIASGLIIVIPSPSWLNSGSDNANKISENLIVDNECGMNITNRSDEKIWHNNFINNTVQAYVLHQYGFNATNIWDNSHPSGGNYWSDYNGTDSDGDGIGDSTYIIDSDNRDNYPLIGMFSDFNVTSEYHVQTICNSSISDFVFNGTAMSFNVSGENGTAGFCRICIPIALMNGTYRVFVNGTEVLPAPLPLPCSNSTHTYLYFTYNHSTQEVIIIPEFPSFLILPLYMTATLLAVIVHRREHSK